MVRSKVLFAIILALMFTACTSEVVTKINISFEGNKEAFEQQYEVSNLFDHFPKKLNKTCTSMEAFPPSKRGANYTGLIYLICSLDNYESDLNLSMYKKDSDWGLYENESFVINTEELKRPFSLDNKYNSYNPNSEPIPYFEGFDFGLGYIEESKIIENRTVYSIIYEVPSDLKVFVIDSKNGNFWKDDCRENRPEALKDWRYGYSKGVAISKDQNQIVYWTMIW